MTARLEHLKEKASALIRNMNQMESINTALFSENYHQLCISTVCQAEKIACALRQYVYAVGGATQEEIMKQAIKEQSIQLHETSGYCEIELPGLLPKKGNEKNSRFLTDPLFFYLYEYSKLREVMKFCNCVVCFMHVYDRGLPQQRIHDYDNLELKQILDVIATFFLVDDSGSNCDMYHTTRLGDKDCTRIYIMDKAAFPQWLLKQDKDLLIG